MGIEMRPLQETNPITGAPTPGIADTESAKKKRRGKKAVQSAKGRTQRAPISQPAVPPDNLNPKPFLGER